jgi:hypothetical protein
MKKANVTGNIPGLEGCQAITFRVVVVTVASQNAPESNPGASGIDVVTPPKPDFY